jgi:GTPase
MTEKTRWESFKAEGANVIDRLNNLIREGNVRRVIVEHKGKTVAEFPLTVGVVGAVIAPVAALVGVLVAILQDCTIKVEREVSASGERPPATPEVLETK